MMQAVQHSCWRNAMLFLPSQSAYYFETITNSTAAFSDALP